jgi:ubiquinone/menaquinone biosynthesis C-methylase UbiE
MTQSTDAIRQKAEQLRNWDDSAVGWNKFFDKFEVGAQCVSDRLVELARIQPGNRVLDVATGVGEPAVTAARRVGSSGRVVATDHSSQMIKLAGERAASRGLGNVDFQTMDAEVLDLPDRSFDAIVCRWGLMFLPDLPSALSRMHELLVPGGWLAASVWADAPKVPMIGLILGVCRQFELPRPPAGSLGPLSLSDIDALKKNFQQAGFSEISSESITVTFEFASGEEYVRFQQRIQNPTTKLIGAQPAETQEKIWKAAAESTKPYADADGVVRLANECVCVAARR